MPSDWTAADRKWVCTEVPLPRRTLVRRSGRSRSPPSGTWHCACCWSSACRSDGNFPVAVFPRTSLFCVKSFEVRSVQFVSLDETTLNHQLNDRLVTYSVRHRNIPCWISNIKEFDAKRPQSVLVAPLKVFIKINFSSQNFTRDRGWCDFYRAIGHVLNRCPSGDRAGLWVHYFTHGINTPMMSGYMRFIF